MTFRGREYVVGKARGLRRRVLVAVFTFPPVRRRLRERARRAWREADAITFVCFGNICRSPFAEGLARLKAVDRRFASAGTLPKSGRPSPDTAITVAQHWSVDLREHRSRVFDAESLAEASVVFVFDVDNLIRIWRDHPSIRDRVHLLGALSADGPLLVPDPYGGTPEVFASAYARIAEVIDGDERPKSLPAL